MAVKHTYNRTVKYLYAKFGDSGYHFCDFYAIPYEVIMWLICIANKLDDANWVQPGNYQYHIAYSYVATYLHTTNLQ